jgi:hypothetical protein
MADPDGRPKAPRAPRKQAAKTVEPAPPARFKTGARPPKDAPALAFGRFRRQREVEEYPPVNYLDLFDSWQVLGNDRAGDCVAVWWANARRLVTGALTTENYPDQDEVWILYRTQNPLFDPDDPTSFDGPNDNGMEAQTLLEHLVHHGGPDGVKAVGFAKVDHSDLAEMKAAISTAGSLLLIVTVSQAQYEQFDARAPWDFDERSETDGQHAVLAGGHTDEVTGDLTIVTWGSQTELSDVYLRNAVVQAWMVIWPEHLGDRQFLDGMDLDAFAAAYAEITGRPFPVKFHRFHKTDWRQGEDAAPGALDGADGDAERAAQPDGTVDHAALDSALLRALAPILNGRVASWQETHDMRTAIQTWAAGKEGEDLMTEQPEVNPQTAHRDDQRAQLDNEQEYLPSAHARTRHLLEDAANQAEIRADHQREALDDLRQRESRTKAVQEHIGAEDRGELTAEDQDRDPVYADNASEASGHRIEISKDDEPPRPGKDDTSDEDRGHKPQEPVTER